KTDEYNNLIRQHVDLETVQTRIDDGSYSSLPSRFYLDLLLLFNNATVFFPKASDESVAAVELRRLFLKEFKKRRVSSSDGDPSLDSSPISLQPKPEPERSDSLLAKQKSATPIVVCRKRSSISAKSSSVNKTEKKVADEKPVANAKLQVKSSSSTPNEEESSVKMRVVKEKPVTGTRSMRRSSKGRPNSTPSNSNQQNTNSSSKPSSVEKIENLKTEKKRDEVISTAKKRGAADFLKRIKKNSPAKGSTLAEALKSTSGQDANNGGGKRDPKIKKRLDERKDGMVRRSGNGGGRGGGSGKKVKEENSPSKRGVGRPPKKGKEATTMQGKRRRDGGEAEASSRRPKKRSRR
ncbi:unnamed protein product, partial [Ilex paraguariensis]